MTAAGGGATSFVGRERELEAILDAAAMAAAGRSGTILLEGSSGMGATRLIAEVLQRLDADPPAGGPPPVVIRGDDLPAWRGAPYAPFRVALEQLLLGRSSADALQLLGPAAEVLLPLLPATADRLSAAGPGPATRERLADRTQEAIRGLVSRLAAEGPVVVVIEDLHVLDAASRTLLAFLARTLGERPVLLVGSYQPEAMGRGHPLRATLDAIASVPRPPRRITVSPLDRGSLRDLIAAREGEAPSAPTLLLVAERSGGSPLVAEEVLVARRELAGASLALPLEQLVLARVALRSPECRRVLRILAVADGPLDAEQLAGVARAYDAEVGHPAPHSARARPRGVSALAGDISAGAREALDHGFAAVFGPLEPRPGAGREGPAAGHADRAIPRLRVRHELLAAALAADLLPASRRRMHAAVAGALTDHPDEACRHWQAAHDAERLLGAEVAAAARAEHVGAAADALDHLERALELVGVPAAGEVPPEEELRLLVHAADASAGAGDAGRAAAFLELALARPHAARDRDRLAALSRQLGACRWAGGDHAGALGAYERALELTPLAPTAERARILALVAHARMLEGRFSDAERIAVEAIGSARAAGEGARAWLGHATCTLGGLDSLLGRPGDAIRHHREALAIAVELGRLDDAFRARANLAAAHDYLGDRAAAIDVSRQGIAAAEAAGLEVAHGNILRGNAVDALVSLGEWHEAREMAERALDWAPSGPSFVMAALGLAMIETEQRAGEAAASLLGRLFLELETVPDTQYAIPAYQTAASLALWRGDTADAVRAVSAAWSRVRGTEQWVLAGRTAAVALAVANARADLFRERPDRAAVAANRAWSEGILVEARRMVDSSGAPPDSWVRQEVDVDLATAQAYRARLRGSDNPATWANVVARWRAVGRPYDAARARFLEAEAHLAGGSQPGARREGRDEAREAILDAAATALELDAQPFLRAIRDVAGRSRISLPEAVDERLEAAAAAATGAPSPPPAASRATADRAARPASTFGLSARERGVLAEIVAGRTNRAIGERLFISEKTVGVHVGKILAKLGVGGRVEAAMVAVRLGLVDDLLESTKKPGPRGPGSTGRRGGAA